MARIAVGEGQDIFDVALQFFGDIENIFDIFADNPEVDLNTTFAFGQEIDINAEGKGIVLNKEFFTRNESVLVNDEEGAGSLGDYNDDYNNDFDI